MNSFIFDNTRGIRHKFKQVYDDLDISRICPKLNRTITVFGKRRLESELKCIRTDPRDLQEHINLIQQIRADPHYVEIMSSTLEKIKLDQAIILDWMQNKPDQVAAVDVIETMDNASSDQDASEINNDDVNEINNDNKDSALYFRPSMYNPYNVLNNRVTLSISNRLMMSSIMIMICMYVFLYLYMNYHGLDISIKEYTLEIYEGYVAFCKIMLSLMMTNIEWIERIAIVIAVTYVGYQIYSTYLSMRMCYEHYCLCADFTDRYARIATYLGLVEDLMKHDRILLDEECNSKLKVSLDYLKSYFNKDSGLGFSLVTQIKSYDYIDHMNLLANYIGKIDMLCGLSALLSEKYTCPLIINSTKTPNCPYDFPYLGAHDVWNPLLGYSGSVKNTLIMSPDLPNVLILTGPNKAGKSTFMKSLLLAVYLAQSIGVTCAGLSLTPFRDLFTYLNIPDSIGRESLFEAEVNRCYTYLKSAESLRGFSVGIVDELFTGTNPAEGMAGSYAILKQITLNPVNITIVSTHFHDMLDRLGSTDFMYRMFECDVKIRNGKTIHTFDYVMRHGISHQKIGLSLLKEKGFDQRTVRNAQRFIRLLDMRSAGSAGSAKNVESERRKRSAGSAGSAMRIRSSEKSVESEETIEIEEKVSVGLDEQLRKAIAYSSEYDKRYDKSFILRGA